MHKLNVLVAGSTGYIGIQLIKLLNIHKEVKIKYLCGDSSVGRKISDYEKSLKLIKFLRKVWAIFFHFLSLKLLFWHFL